MDSLVCRYLIKIVEHLSEVNTVMADAVPCEQALPDQQQLRLTDAGVCSELDRIKIFLYLRQPLRTWRQVVNTVVFFIVMGHICLQSDVPVISHKVDGGRSQINHGNWLVQTLDSVRGM